MLELLNFGFSSNDIIWSNSTLKNIKTKTDLSKLLLYSWPSATLNLSGATMRTASTGMEFYTNWTTEFITVPNFQIPKKIKMTYYTPSLDHRGFRITLNSSGVNRYIIYYHDNERYPSVNGMFINGSYDGSPAHYGYQKIANAATGYRGDVVWDSSLLIKNDPFYLSSNISMSMMSGYNDRTPGKFIIEQLSMEY